MKLLNYILILFLLLISCKNSKVGYDSIKCDGININPQECKDEFLSNIVDSIKYIKLETSNDNLIGNVDKVVFASNYIFILDKSITRSIFRFDLAGNYLGKINKIGKGPGEYIKIRDFLVDTIKKTIEVYEPQQRKIIVYDYEGNFKTFLPIGLLFSNFEKLNDKYVLHTNKMINSHKNKPLNYSLLIVNNSGELDSRYFPFDPKLKTNNVSYDVLKVITKDDSGNIYISKLLNDSIFLISNNHLFPKYVFNYGKYQMPSNYNILPSDELLKKLSSTSNYALGHMLCAKTSNYMYFTFGFKEILKEQYIALYNTESHKSNGYRRLINDIDGGIFNHPITSYNNQFISVIRSEELLDYVNNKSSANNMLNNKLLDLVKTSSKLDNPILMLTTFKDNI